MYEQLSLLDQIAEVKVIQTDSPINKLNLSGQNYRLLMHLLEGKSIHCFSPMMFHLKIGHLHSRISDLKNKHKFNIIPKAHKARNFYGELSDCNLYVMPYSEIERVKKEFNL